MSTVITFGTYDLFHIGHLRLLQRAGRLGSRLVVGVSTDELNFRKKNYYPILSEADRFEILQSLRMVDEVFFEYSLEEKKDYVLEHNADILVMGDDWKGKFDYLNDVCEVIYLDRTEGVSTTKIKHIINVANDLIAAE